MGLPAAAEHVWNWFCELDVARPVGFGPGPIDFVQVSAWAALTGNRVLPWELRALRAMDGLRLQLLSSEDGKPMSERPADVSERPLTGELLDALF